MRSLAVLACLLGTFGYLLPCDAACEARSAVAVHPTFDKLLGTHFPSQRIEVDPALELLTQNVLDNQRKPLGLAIVGEDRQDTEALLRSLECALYEATEPCATRIDLGSDSSQLSTQWLKRELDGAVRSPEERSLIVLDNVQDLRGDKISVLDALLEPLNGSVDKYRNSVIVLLIHEAKASGRAQRRASLTAFQQDRKQALDDFLAYDGPEFSPRALSGRISEVIIIEKTKEGRRAGSLEDLCQDFVSEKKLTSANTLRWLLSLLDGIIHYGPVVAVIGLFLWDSLYWRQNEDLAPKGDKPKTRRMSQRRKRSD